MDNRTAFWLAVAILALFAADYFYLDWNLPQHIGQLLGRLIEWMAVWR